MSSNAMVNVFLEEQFSFNGSDIRTVYIERVPYLLGKDVCLALGYNENTYRNGMKDNVPDKYKVRYENLSNLGLSNRVCQTRLEKAIHKEAIFLLNLDYIACWQDVKKKRQNRLWIGLLKLFYRKRFVN